MLLLIFFVGFFILFSWGFMLFCQIFFFSVLVNNKNLQFENNNHRRTKSEFLLILRLLLYVFVEEYRIAVGFEWGEVWDGVPWEGPLCHDHIFPFSNTLQSNDPVNFSIGGREMCRVVADTYHHWWVGQLPHSLFRAVIERRIRYIELEVTDQRNQVKNVAGFADERTGDIIGGETENVAKFLLAERESKYVYIYFQAEEKAVLIYGGKLGYITLHHIPRVWTRSWGENHLE